MPAAVSPTGTLRPGDVVSTRYRVERFIERHLLEESYAVRAVDDGRPLLLKLVSWPGGAPELTALELQTWKQQASRLAHFRHPLLAQTHDLIPLDNTGKTCLFREPVELEGQPLDAFLLSLGRPLGESEVQLLAAQIGEALDTAHRADLLHLCLSPRRIIVLTDGEGWRVKLTDVGLYPPPLAARFAEPGYLSPEVLSGQPCDARSDQFSLAVILYELLSGQPAFIGGPDEPREVVVQRVLAEDPLPLLLSQKVELALQRALSRSRGVRFPTMRDFVAALGGDVRGFAPQTIGRAPAIKPPKEHPWPRLWLPMAQGALWALCGIGLLFGARKLLVGPKRAQPEMLADAATDSPSSADADPSDDATFAAPSDAGEPVAQRTDMARRTDGGIRISHPIGKPGPPPKGATLPNGANRNQPRLPLGRRDAGADEPANSQSDPVADPSPAVFTQVEVSSQDGKLSGAQDSGLRTCVRQVRRPSLPYRVVLENIGGTLYVSPNGTSDEFLTSSDFRDCLKFRISGIVIPKVVTISGKAKGKSSP